MFVDKARVNLIAGNGGHGAVSFRHEKFVDKGGPDGGDGGDGGDIILKASRNQNTLATFRYQKLLKAEDGAPGFKRKKHGKSGKDLEVAVPVGTVVYSEVLVKSGRALKGSRTNTQVSNSRLVIPIKRRNIRGSERRHGLVFVRPPDG